MDYNMKSELEGDTNIRYWKTRTDPIRTREDIMEIVKGKVIELTDEAREKYKKYEITSLSIIMGFIKDHLIPLISKLNTSKNMYDAINYLYTIYNIGQAMSLSNELCDIRMKRNDTISY